ncbi:hypothetical protein C7Y69_16300 [Alteromonas sp. KS69]|jgi:Tfp pilus assembly protein PilE|uniref:hypothetical protein n=1 Tax=unclassified Alteromonas TaxID=2614992 RepID=UPI000F87A96E|nr:MULTISPECIES: hypothetical protein [unclassified Alteromonas]MBO7924571.1 hypothetical protein [Alteromonas sp. K632G]RUP77097.1 hypothetical protein C7Y69_16300 [Alteromonas sp. KS69]|tara:strand:+ start:936 stop:1373 length:438 start_codon:yes stop_codon:yes gene_type:complete
MSVSDLLAVAAILVSILSAVYARYSVSESKRANSIALLAERKQIFKDFYSLKSHMVAFGNSAKMKEVVKFNTSMQGAKLLLPQSLADELDTYFKICFDMARVYEKSKGFISEIEEEAFDLAEKEIEFGNRLEKRFSSYITASINA